MKGIIKMIKYQVKFSIHLLLYVYFKCEKIRKLCTIIRWRTFFVKTCQKKVMKLNHTMRIRNINNVCKSFTDARTKLFNVDVSFEWIPSKLFSFCYGHYNGPKEVKEKHLVHVCQYNIYWSMHFQIFIEKLLQCFDQTSIHH